MSYKIEPSLDDTKIITLPMVRNFSTGGGHGASAVCTFRVPKKPRHALLRATVTVSALGRSASTAFTATAR